MTDIVKRILRDALEGDDADYALLIEGERKTFKTEHYDYANQAWIGTDDRYLSCNHPLSMNCKCYGRLHAGELARIEVRKDRS